MGTVANSTHYLQQFLSRDARGPHAESNPRMAATLAACSLSKGHLRLWRDTRLNLTKCSVPSLYLSVASTINVPEPANSLGSFEPCFIHRDQDTEVLKDIRRRVLRCCVLSSGTGITFSQSTPELISAANTESTRLKCASSFLARSNIYL